MRKLYYAAILALSFAAAPAHAQICNILPYKVDAGANCYLRITPYNACNQAQLGPWYQYWPLEAHFQTPAMPCYPTWPSPMGLPPSNTGVVPTAPVVPVMPGAPITPPKLPVPTPGGAVNLKPATYQQPAFQPVGYYQQVPSYWYGR
jgi:hypothetical protein